VIRRLRSGELVVLAGIICLIISMFTPWYSSPIGNLDLWDTFGPAAALMLAALCAGLAVVVSALAERGENPALAVGAAVWCVLLGLAGTIAAIVRVLERPDNAGSTCIGPWLGLAGTLGILIGAWLVLRDERPSLYQPARPQPRPRP
jgi:hypothetical protein